jgi:hypothetical protein
VLPYNPKSEFLWVCGVVVVVEDTLAKAKQ